MKNILIILFLSFLSIQVFAQDVFINEINYKVSDQTERGIEIVGPKKSKLTNYKVYLYDQNGILYHTETLNGAIQSSGNTHNAIWFPIAELHNSDNQSMKLEDNTGNVLQEIMIGSNTTSPKNAKAFVNIGIVQVDSTKSLQLIGTGLTLLDFIWVNTQGLSKGGININQLFVLPITVTIKNNSTNSGSIGINWTVPQALNTGYFSVEKSDDGIVYQEIGTVLGYNTRYFNFEDDNLSKGNYEYRIKWIDGDSEILSNSSDVAIEGVVSIEIYPNPVMIGGTLTLNTTTRETLQVQFYNTMGSLVKNQLVNGTTIITLDNLKTGTYYYRIIGNDKQIQEGKILVIQ